MPKVGEKLLPTEVVASVLGNLSKDKRHLSTELRKIHPILFDMKKSCPNVLGDFMFDRRGTFPYSEEIEQAFSNLETAKVLPRVNPDLDSYEIEKALKNYYNKYVAPKLTGSQLDEVKKIAIRFDKIASN
jgi:hypothetical protein